MQQLANIGTMFESNHLLGKPAALNAKLNEDGYLFFRQIIDSKKLLELRQQIISVLIDNQWVLPNVSKMEAKAIGLPRREGEDGFFGAYNQIIKLEKFYELAHDENLTSVMRQVLGPSAFPHPLSIARLVFPNNPEITTPPHQDYPNNQGTSQLTASWIPLGDCKISDGALAILKGSHKLGLLPLQFHLGAGNRSAVLPEESENLEWVSADFSLGDILLFPSLTIHKSLVNHNTENMRLSVDFRYQCEGEKITEPCLNPHFNQLTWDEIYKEWNSDKYQYYWKNKVLELTEWNSSMHTLPDEHLKDAIKQSRAYDAKRQDRHKNNALRGG